MPVAPTSADPFRSDGDGPDPASVPRRGRGKRVLVVEDDPLLAMDLEQALLAAGAGQVRICTGMADAVAALQDWAPHAVVLDVRLADRNDGWAIAEVVGMLGARPPLIAFSTGSPEDIPAHIQDLGTVYAKPYDTARLAADMLGVRPSGLVGRLREALR